jgi:hypothetical protein
VFIAALDANGARKWVVADAGGETFGADQAPRAVVVDGSGNIHVHGDLGGALNFGGETLTPEQGASSATFRVSLTAEGAHRWSGAAYGSISAYGATVSDGVLWLSGLFISESGADFGAGLEAADESYFSRCISRGTTPRAATTSARRRSRAAATSTPGRWSPRSPEAGSCWRRASRAT